MNAFIGWVGGKKALRDIIVNEFPKENIKKYVEVFGGAGSIARCATDCREAFCEKVLLGAFSQRKS